MRQWSEFAEYSLLSRMSLGSNLRPLMYMRIDLERATLILGASLVAQRLKRLPEMWETWVGSLVREDPLEKEMATHSSILAWRIPWTKEPGGLQSMGLQRVRHDWATSLFFSPLSFLKISFLISKMGFSGSSVVKNLTSNAGDGGSIPGLRRSPGDENGSPLQYSCLGNPIERPQCMGSQKYWTWLSN